MKLNDYIANIKLSEVKLLLLTTMWGKGDVFPTPWVTSSTLLNLSKQKYFDRRLRELRDADGLDIETTFVDGEHCWRIRSTKINPSNPRAYLTQTHKTALFKKASNCCAVCGKSMKAGTRGLQADHKIPLQRGGSNSDGNWQALCNECNVAKRGTCADCQDDCIPCPWAFPEIVGFNFLLKLPADLVKQLRDKGITNQSEIQKLVTKLLASHLDD